MLWRRGHGRYKLRAKKNQMWEDKALELDIGKCGEDLRAWWNLKDTFYIWQHMQEDFSASSDKVVRQSTMGAA